MKQRHHSVSLSSAVTQVSTHSSVIPLTHNETQNFIKWTRVASILLGSTGPLQILTLKCLPQGEGVRRLDWGDWVGTVEAAVGSLPLSKRPRELPISPPHEGTDRCTAHRGSPWTLTDRRLPTSVHESQVLMVYKRSFCSTSKHAWRYFTMKKWSLQKFIIKKFRKYCSS